MMTQSIVFSQQLKHLPSIVHVRFVFIFQYSPLFRLMLKMTDSTHSTPHIYTILIRRRKIIGRLRLWMP